MLQELLTHSSLCFEFVELTLKYIVAKYFVKILSRKIVSQSRKFPPKDFDILYKKRTLCLSDKTDRSIKKGP